MDPGFGTHYDRGPHGEEEDPRQSTMDEESQESITLRNALPPLPDTQLSQLEDPEKLQPPSGHHDDVHKLISRPRDTEIDPAASFAFGRPMTITAGQFGRAIPPKPRYLDPEEPLGNNVPNVSDKLAAENPKAMPSDRIQPLSKPIARKPPHIQDHQPHGLPLGPKKHHPALHTSPAHRASIRRERDTVVGQEGGAGSPDGAPPRPCSNTQPQCRDNFPAVTQEVHNHSGHYQQPIVKTNATAIQAHDQGHRVSLPNDTSVSSPVLGHSPRNALSRPAAQANRPMKDLRRVSKSRTPINRSASRSSAQGSNISKKRSGQHNSASGRTSRVRPRDFDEGRETPSAGRHKSPSSVENSQLLSSGHYRRPWVPCDLGQETQLVVQSMNSLFKTFEVNRGQAEMEKSRYERRVQKQQRTLSQYLKETEHQANVIRELEKTQTDLQEQLVIAKQEIADRSEKTSRLEGKCRQYKEYLNSAIAEQQDLYKAARAKCEDAIKQMREAENKQKASNAQERRQNEATRERLNQIVKTTITECKSREREFTNKIELLNQRIQQQEAHISQEREITEKLLQKDEALASVQETVKNMGSQVEHIAATLADNASRQAKEGEAATAATQSQMEKILERLSAIDKTVVPSTDIVQEIQESNAKTFNSILEHVSDSQAQAQAGVQRLADGIEDYMEDFWFKLEDREGVLTELLEQVQAENEQLRTHLQLKHEECDGLFASLSETETKIQEKEKELGALKEEIAVMEQTQAAGMEEAARADLLRHEYDKLKGDLDAKKTLASELQNRLQESQLALTTQGQEHARSTEQLHELLQQREKEAQETRRAAVELARQEVQRDMNKAEETMQLMLTQAREELAKLKDDLELARHKILSMEEEDKRKSVMVSELTSDLQTTKSRAESLNDEVIQNKTEHQKWQEQRSVLIKDLEAKIAAKEEAVVHLSKDSQTYAKKAQDVLEALKNWTRENESLKDFVFGLEKAERGDLDGIDSELRSLSEIDMLHRAMFQYFEAQRGVSLSASEVQRTVGQHTEERHAVPEVARADDSPNSTPEYAPPSTAISRVLDQIRRVTVRSPPGLALSPRPPSVGTEQARRRSAGPPKSIMKVLAHSPPLTNAKANMEQDGSIQEGSMFGRSAFTGRTYGRSAAEKKHRKQEPIQGQSLPSHGSFGRKTQRQAATPLQSRQDERVMPEGPADAGSMLNHGIFKHGRYSTHVAGTNPRSDGCNSRDQPHSSMLGAEFHHGQGTNTGDAVLGGVSRKRRQSEAMILPQETGQARKRAKTDIMGPQSLISTPPSQPEHQTEQEQSIPMPSAPRKKGHNTDKVDSGSSSPSRYSQFMRNQHTSQTSDVAPTGSWDRTERRALSNTQNMSSQDIGKSPKASYYQQRRPTRGIEESQDSMTHSQDVSWP